MRAVFTETVVIDTRRGRPTLAMEIGGELRHAAYVADEAGYFGHPYWRHQVFFAYTDKPGDRDFDGLVRILGHPRVPEGSSITDLAGNHAVLDLRIPSPTSPIHRFPTHTISEFRVDGG